jgi:RND family efflux transporter MFP subunit
MQKILNASVIGLLLLAASCGSSSVNKDSNSLEGKKAELAQLKEQQDKLIKQINGLEAEIAKLDPASVKAEKAKLVAVTALAPVSFTHYIDLQGKIDAENISYIAPRGGGGVVRAIYVKKGDQVKQGKLLLKLDDAVAKQQLANAQTQLAYAKDLYQRRKNLWDQKIGTEVDLVNAKNNVDQAENQIKLLQEQLGFTNVYADINGVVDDITVKTGEIFTGANQLRLVNTSDLKAVVQVPEVYQERVKVGTPVKIVLPELNNKTIIAKVRVAGKVIDPGSRSFYIEAKVPYDKDLRPNQIALTKIQDYTTSSALTIPVNTLQTDDKGKYVMVAATENGKTVAHKRIVTIGQLYEDKIEIKSGLQQGDQVITDGFQGLYEGQLITTKA